MLACQADRVGVVELLIARGADVNSNGEKGESALAFAKLRQHSAEIRQILIEAGAVA